MAETALAPSSPEVISPTLDTRSGHITASSLQVAEHFQKQHKAVLRTIRNLGVSAEFGRRNFAPSSYLNDQGKEQPQYQITRDGFAMLAMGFTGKEAIRWKEAYIAAFNAMEARLKSLYVEPLVDDKQFRNGIPLHMKFKLQEQSFQIMGRLMAEQQAAARRNLYWQLRQVNDALGIPTESAELLLGADAPVLPVLEGGAA